MLLGMGVSLALFGLMFNCNIECSIFKGIDTATVQQKLHAPFRRTQNWYRAHRRVHALRKVPKSWSNESSELNVPGRRVDVVTPG